MENRDIKKITIMGSFLEVQPEKHLNQNHQVHVRNTQVPWLQLFDGIGVSGGGPWESHFFNRIPGNSNLPHCLETPADVFELLPSPTTAPVRGKHSGKASQGGDIRTKV